MVSFSSTQSTKIHCIAANYFVLFFVRNTGKISVHDLQRHNSFVGGSCRRCDAGTSARLLAIELKSVARLVFRFGAWVYGIAIFALAGPVLEG